MYKKPANFTKNDFSGLVSRKALLHWIREFVEQSGLSGEYWEFGVYNGESIKESYYILRDVVKRYVGFDSFAGLPKTATEADSDGTRYQHQFVEKSYSSVSKEFVQANILSTGMDPIALELIKGYFKDSLSQQLQNDYLKRESKPIVIHMDVDYYESTYEALEFCYPLLTKGCWMLFDDYWTYRGSTTHGTQLAISRFLENHDDVILQEYTSYRGWSKGFIVDIK